MPDREKDKFWERAFSALVRIARARGVGPGEAEDRAQKALVDAWSAGGERGELKAYVFRAAALMRRGRSNERRAAKRREDPSWLIPAVERTTPLRRTPEDLASARERQTKTLAELFERTRADPVCRGMVEKIVEGFDRPADLARELQTSIDEIRSAQRRLARLTAEIVERDGPVGEPHGWDITMRARTDKDGYVQDAEAHGMEEEVET